MPNLSGDRDFTLRSQLAPLIFWLVAQLCTLAISAFRIPLWLGQTRIAEDDALRVMATVQIVLLSMGAPLLLSDWRRATATGCTLLPFVALAALLSATTPATAARVAGFEIVWLAILSVAVTISPNRRVRSFFAAIATLWAVGGATTAYLGAEFSGLTIRSNFACGPLIEAQHLVSNVTNFTVNSYGYFAVFAAVVVANLVVRRTSSATTYPQSTAPFDQ